MNLCVSFVGVGAGVREISAFASRRRVETHRGRKMICTGELREERSSLMMPIEATLFSGTVRFYPEQKHLLQGLVSLS